MVFNSDFERIKFYFEKGWASKEQVAKYVQYGVITSEEYEEIVGEPYPN